MTTRRPLVLNNGLVSELLDGDTVSAGTSTTEVIAGSGLTGGGSISSSPQLDVALAPNPSGIIYVGDALGLDGVAQVTANTALASGSAAAVLASNALASGNNSLVVGTAALASGNAALDLVPTLTGGGPLQTTLVAGSAIASGYAVGVDDAGKVQSIRSVIVDNSNPMSFPSPAVVFESASTNFISSTYDSLNNKTVVAYQDAGNANYGTAIVGTVSDTSISFGTPVVFVSAAASFIDIVFDSNAGKVVIVYRDSGTSNFGRAIVGTVSGTTISFGTPVTFVSAIASYNAITFDSTNNKVVIAFTGTSNYGYSVVGTVSGTSISVGAAVVFESAASFFMDITYDATNNRVVIAYVDNGNSDYGTSIVGTVSGTSISFGTAVVFQSASTSVDLALTYSSTDSKVVLLYYNAATSRGAALVGTVSGTSISFGSPGYFSSPALVTTFSAAFASDSNRVIEVHSEGFTYVGVASAGTISGTSISFGTPISFETGSTNSYKSVVYNTTEKRTVISYADLGNSTFGTSIVADNLLSSTYVPNLNSYPNVLGISQSTVASGSPCLVNLPGSLYNNPAANLTTGAFYYANPTTSGITTTATKPTGWNGQVPWNYIGRAVSTSGLMLLKSI